MGNCSDESGEREAGSTSGGADRPVSEDVLELGYVYRALGSRRRRYALYALAAGDAGTLADLVRRVTAREVGCPEGLVPPEARERVRVSLTHTHLPKLDADGVVSYDATAGRVALDDRAEPVLAALRGFTAALDGE